MQNVVAVGIVFSALVGIGFLFYYRRWTWLWREWLTSLDPKRIGAMYLIVAVFMLFKGLSDAALMRAQQVLAVGSASGILSSEHFQQIFTAHGTTMIFFVGMGTIFGLMNLVIPLQIGARDVAFPFLNAISFWLFASGALLLLASMMVGNFADTGWVAYPPLSGLRYNPGTGVDYWIWSVQIAGVGSLLSAINFWGTIVRMRCPGMTMLRLPLFVWASVGTLILILFAFPVLTAVASMLALDRLVGSHFFTAGSGGSPMMYVNLIWAWGHPEVYVLILPAFGIFSEVVATFSSKRLFGYTSMVVAIFAIVFLSFTVWLHHFFTMGAGPNVNAVFGIMTMIIAVPTGVKIFNWLFTMYQGRIRLTTPMLWFLGFVFIFTTGGMTGVLLSVAPFNFQAHNSLFLIAHFHSMLIGGLLFGFFAGFSYWFPKFTGRKLNERVGRYAFFCWIVGFMAAFFPLYVLGLMGATRRLNHYELSTGWQPLFIIAAVGVTLIIIGVLLQIIQVIASVKNKESAGDLWDGRTLEWSTSSPPPLYNFARIPQVHTRDAFHQMKKEGIATPEGPMPKTISMPKNTPLGFFIGGLSFLVGFGLVWHMFWLAAVGLVGILACLIVRLSDPHTEVEVPVTI